MRATPFIARLLRACLLLPGAVAAQSPAPAPAPPVAQPDPGAACEVWSRELGFAGSIAGHDGAAFAEHVHADAVFGPGRPQPARGRDAVVQQWQGLIEGKGLRLSWYPAHVVVAGSGDLAWSTGPALYDDPAPGAPQRYRLSQFQSVWRRDADGAWRVLFDDGSAATPASAEQVAAFRAGRRVDCPY